MNNIDNFIWKRQFNFPGMFEKRSDFYPLSDKHWRHLQSGDCLVHQMPRDRFDVNQLYNADRSAAGRTYSKHGGFLDDDIFAFDPSVDRKSVV